MGKKKIAKFTKPSELISLEKHFQLENPQIRPSTRAFLIRQFHGILKVRDEWNVRLKEIIQ